MSVNAGYGWQLHTSKSKLITDWFANPKGHPKSSQVVHATFLQKLKKNAFNSIKTLSGPLWWQNFWLCYLYLSLTHICQSFFSQFQNFLGNLCWNRDKNDLKLSHFDIMLVPRFTEHFIEPEIVVFKKLIFLNLFLNLD